MIKSMTGFGKAVRSTDELNVTVEVKSLNSKFFDSSIKIGNIFFDKDIELKNLMGKRLERGKISLSVNYTTKRADLNKVSVNRPLFNAFYTELQSAAESVGADGKDIFRMAMSMPDVYLKENDEDTKKEDWKVVLETIHEAIDKCDEFRMAEGNALERKLVSYIDSIEELLVKVDGRDPERIAKVRERLMKQVEEWLSNENFDKNRFEQELMYYIEKLDINEEKVRLKNHLSYFKETLKAKTSLGKKLNFISQEIGREINTIGSKANDAEIQKLVINMKEELEKIKEQVLNVL
ncbi:YicC/YloC family endoribonuclease [Flammeovirgaceae bacterium SG7u.111]|nr:YicC/YloC family endoribonuclease [Flammeovirgaceae bacterium SG7u.132]WPO33292.1 YicC/YloC family endoribonuclease [Flammeovirgaceae bacterium SG7u.111]